jgi:23S rRNA pseudouridine2605 synthase
MHTTPATHTMPEARTTSAATTLLVANEPASGTDLPASGSPGVRLQKVLAAAGVGSRRACEELIAAGRVEVNGETAELGRRVDPGRDRVAVDGVPIGVAPGLVYYLVYKPLGVVSTTSDPQGRPTVAAVVPAEPRVYPVGRLDVDSEGLMLLTNDGELTYRLTHPSFGVEKEYVVTVSGLLDPSDLRRLRQGVDLEDGMTAPARVALLGPGVLRITIHEGRNRQVRRMADAIGHPVLHLVRTRLGPLRIGSLRPGQWRELELHEVRALEMATRGPSGSRKLVRRANRRRPPVDP